MERLKNDAARQRTRRKEMKDLVADLPKESHENSKGLRKFMHDKQGIPALEDSHPDLHKAIVAITTAGAGADSRRRTENLNVCLTLDDLRDYLIKDGYELSRSALYLRLLPRQ